MARHDAASATATAETTTCWECSANCGALATVKDGRVVAYAPNPEAPHSKGAFCIKGIRGAPGLTYNPNRLLYPHRRTGARGQGKWARISWDEALDEMADRLAAVREKFGPEAIVGATSGANFSRSLIMALTLRSIGSPNWMINQDLCGGCRAVSARITGLNIQRGEDIEHTRCALIVGRNSSIADPIEWTALKAAKKRGAKLVVIDPKRTPVAQIADLWLSPRVGTDAALALAMINVMIAEGLYNRAYVEKYCHGFDDLARRGAAYSPEVAAGLTGVAAADIVKAARLYADGPATFVSGHGIDASSVGVQTFRAFHALVAISGNVDRVGGNLRSRAPKGFSSYVELLHRPEFRLDLETEQRTIGADRFPLWAGPRGWQTACHNPTVIEAMLTGKPRPVRALIASGVNILVTYPDTRRTIDALQSLDFVAVAAHQMTPTAEFADIVLPKTTTLEEEEVSFMPSGPTVLLTRRLAPPQGEARQEIEIMAPLLERMSARQAITKKLLPWTTQRQFNTHLLGDSGITMQGLLAKGYHHLPSTPVPSDRPFATKTGKIELYSQTLAELGLDPLPGHVAPARDAATPDIRARYPLTLITGDREKSYHHSRFRDQDWALKVSPDPRLVMHPETARAQGLADGDWVRLEVAGIGSLEAGPSKTGSSKTGPSTAGSRTESAGCRLRVKFSDTTPRDVVNTGMGWWLPATDDPTHGALDININAALDYSGPYDPVSGSSDIRGQLCRVERVADAGGTANPG